jgi:hypothetical protein
VYPKNPYVVEDILSVTVKISKKFTGGKGKSRKRSLNNYNIICQVTETAGKTFCFRNLKIFKMASIGSLSCKEM